LNELRRVLALFAATVVGTSLSGIAGTASFVLFHSSAASLRALIRRLAGTVRFAKDEWWAHQGSNLGPDD
jgi:hypothetical protein